MAMKIYDCFIFFNELDILEIRLNTLDKYVDYFVIVECKKTFTYQDKPLHYLDNRKRFEKFKDKIIYVPMDFGGKGEWGNEFAQRDNIREGLYNASDEDIIMISDVDEIPNLKGFNFKKIGEKVAGFPMQYYYYYLNNAMSLKQIIIKAFKKSYLIENSPQTMRGFVPEILGKKMGWHFSYMGGVEKIKSKLDAFAHQDMNLPQFNNDTHLQARIERNEDLFDRSYGFEVMPINTMPEYVINNQDKFKHLLK